MFDTSKAGTDDDHGGGRSSTAVDGQGSECVLRSTRHWML